MRDRIVEPSESRGEKFYIRESAYAPKGGSVRVKFDSYYLTMLGAAVERDEIVWKFGSLRSGNTKVLVIIDGGKYGQTRQITYNVKVSSWDSGRRWIESELV